MKLETKIQQRGNKLVIVLSDLLVKKGAIKAGDLFEVEIQDKTIIIKNKNAPKLQLEEIITTNATSIFSKTLSEEELILAK